VCRRSSVTHLSSRFKGSTRTRKYKMAIIAWFFNFVVPASIVMFQVHQHCAYCATTRPLLHRCPHLGRIVSFQSPTLAVAFSTPDELINDVCG
jgi:hypothetical protein